MIPRTLPRIRALRRLDEAFERVYRHAWFRALLFLSAMLVTWLGAGGVAGD